MAGTASIAADALSRRVRRGEVDEENATAAHDFPFSSHEFRQMTANTELVACDTYWHELNESCQHQIGLAAGSAVLRNLRSTDNPRHWL
jgi:hypothetical protein